MRAFDAVRGNSVKLLDQKHPDEMINKLLANGYNSAEYPQTCDKCLKVCHLGVPYNHVGNNLGFQEMKTILVSILYIDCHSKSTWLL